GLAVGSGLNNPILAKCAVVDRATPTIHDHRAAAENFMYNSIGEIMKKATKPRSVERQAGSGGAIAGYAKAQPIAFRTICDRLRKLIDASLSGATSKVWHGSPVWFIDENPVVGYNATGKAVNLLFWNGQAFDEPVLKPVGKYGAAQAV